MDRRVLSIVVFFSVFASAIMLTGCGGGTVGSKTSASTTSSTSSGNTSSTSTGNTSTSGTAAAVGATASSDFVAYPATAQVNNHVENATWNSCNCGGTGAQSATQSLTQNSTSLDMSIKGSGSGVSGWLWYSSFPGINASNWILDYEVTPTSNPTAAAALEFDGNQTGSLGNFVFGTECNYGYNTTQKTVWRFWTTSGSSETWGTTSYACPITQTNHTYHVQVYFVATSGSYQVKRMKVTDLTTATVVEDDSNLGTFNSVGANTGHGNSIDIQPDVPGSNSLTAQYKNIKVVRW